MKEIDLEATLKSIQPGHPALEREQREGVEHFVTGQHYATWLEDDSKDSYLISFVPVTGHHVVLVATTREIWNQLTPKFVAHQTVLSRDEPHHSVVELKRTEGMIKAVEALHERG